MGTSGLLIEQLEGSQDPQPEVALLDNESRPHCSPYLLICGFFSAYLLWLAVSLKVHVLEIWLSTLQC